MAKLTDPDIKQVHFPATQADLADMLGMTAVHVNRTLSELRSRRILTWSCHEVQVLDFEKLAEVADFDAAYLGPGLALPSQFLSIFGKAV